MTLAEAIAAVEATLDAPYLLVDRRLTRADASSYLLLVLDTQAGRHDDDEPIANGPRLVARDTGAVTRLTVPEALARAQQMELVRS